MNPFSFLQKNVASSPTRVAVHGPGVTMSNQELLEASESIAWLMHQRGVNRGDLVLMNLSQEVECAAMLAAFHLGAVSAHVSIASSPKYMEQLGAQWLLTSDLQNEIEGVSTIRLSAEAIESAGAIGHDFSPVVLGEGSEVLRIVFSSGTTGSPKAVPFTGDQLLARSEFLKNNVMVHQPFMCALGFDVSFGFMTFFACVRYNLPYLLPGGGKFILDQIQDFPLQSLATSPAGLAGLLRSTDKAVEDYFGLKAIFTTGGFLGEEEISQAVKVFGCEPTSLYGSTEVGFVAAKNGIGEGSQDCGELFPHSNVEVVDESDKALPSGQPGVIRVKTPWKGSEYFRDPETSSQYFRDGYFYPGDKGLIVNNRLQLMGRSNLVVNAGGVKIDPVPIEDFCIKELGCAEAVGFEHTNPGGSRSFVVAIVSSSDFNPTLAMERLRSTFGTVAPSRFFAIPVVPKNSLGKPLRQVISRQLSVIDNKTAG
ncbi:MAG: acyl--CoA ligase [Aquiluna sp.]|nr:acyl--CoA ligase [Aquiluna sp.]MCF8546183.1 acyl--CoA ligase [Aquiluna sp.]